MTNDFTGILSALVVVVLAVLGLIVRARKGGRSSGGQNSGGQRSATRPAASRTATLIPAPGQDATTATVELDPRSVRDLRVGYAPRRDGVPDPGEIVWTWVPYAERDGRGKDRPVLVIAAQSAQRVYAIKLTRSHDGDRDFLSLGSGPWDAQGRESWVDVDQLYSVHVSGMRREAAALDRRRFQRVAGVLQRRFGWTVAV